MKFNSKQYKMNVPEKVLQVDEIASAEAQKVEGREYSIRQHTVVWKDRKVVE